MGEGRGEKARVSELGMKIRRRRSESTVDQLQRYSCLGVGECDGWREK